jgi:hypothetical protein
MTGLALLAAMAFLSGAAAQDKVKGIDAGKHDHAEVGPHKGALAEWGAEEYHVEFTVDHKMKQATVYVLDGTAKTAKPIDAKELTLTLKFKPPVTMMLQASPQQGDPRAMASRYVGTHDGLANHRDIDGTISGKVRTQPYSGDFKSKNVN